MLSQNYGSVDMSYRHENIKRLQAYSGVYRLDDRGNLFKFGTRQSSSVLLSKLLDNMESMESFLGRVEKKSNVGVRTEILYAHYPNTSSNNNGYITVQSLEKKLIERCTLVNREYLITCLKYLLFQTMLYLFKFLKSCCWNLSTQHINHVDYVKQILQSVISFNRVPQLTNLALMERNYLIPEFGSSTNYGPIRSIDENHFFNAFSIPFWDTLAYIYSLNVKNVFGNWSSILSFEQLPYESQALSQKLYHLISRTLPDDMIEEYQRGFLEKEIGYEQGKNCFLSFHPSRPITFIQFMDELYYIHHNKPRKLYRELKYESLIDCGACIYSVNININEKKAAINPLILTEREAGITWEDPSTPGANNHFDTDFPFTFEEMLEENDIDQLIDADFFVYNARQLSKKYLYQCFGLLKLSLRGLQFQQLIDEARNILQGKQRMYSRILTAARLVECGLCINKGIGNKGRMQLEINPKAFAGCDTVESTEIDVDISMEEESLPSTPPVSNSMSFESNIPYTIKRGLRIPIKKSRPKFGLDKQISKKKLNKNVNLRQGTLKNFFAPLPSKLENNNNDISQHDNNNNLSNNAHKENTNQTNLVFKMPCYYKYDIISIENLNKKIKKSGTEIFRPDKFMKLGKNISETINATEVFEASYIFNKVYQLIYVVRLISNLHIYRKRYNPLSSGL